MRFLRRLGAMIQVLTVVGGCQSNAEAPDRGEPEPVAVDRERLLDAQSCRACHPGHYAEWAGSMHAYASLDPVFLAMNRRGQEETEGALGDFCVKCHAPMAVAEGLTTDGLNLEELPSAVQGVTCYFCHSVVDVKGEHNNPLELSTDGIMRGPQSDPQQTSAHASAYSSFLDSGSHDSARMCGACHDVNLEGDLVAREVHLERTFLEWQETLFNKPVAEGGVTCNGCHMPISAERESSATTEDAPQRFSRRHDFEGVDLAITEFEGRDRQRLLVERFLASALLAELCVSETGVIQLTLENVGGGHHFPSGAAHDREPWVELVAYRRDETEPVFATVAPELASDGQDSVVLKDWVVDPEGQPAHMFWDVAELEQTTTIPGVSTRDPLDPDFHAERRIFQFDTQQLDFGSLERVTLLLRVRPIALSVLEDLVDSGHLEPELVEAMPVIDVLPDACVDPDLAERFPELVPASSSSCGEDSDFTLVWTKERAEAESTRSRRTTVDGVPASCYAHPTYVAVPNVP